MERARRLREALRKLLHVNNVGGGAAEAMAAVTDAARDVKIVLQNDGKVSFTGDGAIGEVTAVALTAMLDGSWPRLKVCRKCEWAFYDSSKNRSGSVVLDAALRQPAEDACLPYATEERGVNGLRRFLFPFRLARLARRGRRRAAAARRGRHRRGRPRSPRCSPAAS